MRNRIGLTIVCASAVCILGNLSAISALAASPQKAPESLAIQSEYRCEGVDFSGQPYSGSVHIRRDGEVYALTWEVSFSRAGKVRYEGLGIRVGDTLAATWIGTGKSGIIAYRIGPDGNLDGRWTVFGNKSTKTENLRPVGTPSTPQAKSGRSTTASKKNSALFANSGATDNRD